MILADGPINIFGFWWKFELKSLKAVLFQDSNENINLIFFIKKVSLRPPEINKQVNAEVSAVNLYIWRT